MANVKRVNAITSLRLDRLIDHNLAALMDVSIQFSPSLSRPSLLKNDSASRDATEGTPIDSSPSPHIDLVDPSKNKQEESKKRYDTYQPSTAERIYKPVIPFPNRLRRKKDQTYIDKIRETFS